MCFLSILISAPSVCHLCGSFSFLPMVLVHSQLPLCTSSSLSSPYHPHGVRSPWKRSSGPSQTQCTECDSDAGYRSRYRSRGLPVGRGRVPLAASRSSGRRGSSLEHGGPSGGDCSSGQSELLNCMPPDLNLEERERWCCGKRE